MDNQRQSVCDDVKAEIAYSLDVCRLLPVVCVSRDYQMKTRIEEFFKK